MYAWAIWTKTQSRGNITNDPLFADADNGDYHLKSHAGRWNPDAEEYAILDPNDTPSDPNDDIWVVIGIQPQ